MQTCPLTLPLALPLSLEAPGRWGGRCRRRRRPGGAVPAGLRHAADAAPHNVAGAPRVYG